MFRPCIDLHEGKVKQIVGGTLGGDPAALRTNFVSQQSARWYAELYKRDGLKGGHLIMLGLGNEGAAREALGAYPGGLQIGGGINLDNTRDWLEAGASHVIVTSWVFRNGQLDFDRVRALVAAIGQERLVFDLSCRRRDHDYWVVTDHWQKFTEFKIDRSGLGRLAAFCAEFLQLAGLHRFAAVLLYRPDAALGRRDRPLHAAQRREANSPNGRRSGRLTPAARGR